MTVLEVEQIDVKPGLEATEWRKLVGHCFETPPEVEHVEQAVRGF